MNDAADPVGTVTERWRSAQPWPAASETVRKTFPDGTVRQWTRRRGDEPWIEQQSGASSATPPHQET